MNYIVHWTDVALNELAAVWTAATDQNAVTAASHRLEQDITADPYGAAFYGSRPPTTPRSISHSGSNTT